MINRFTLLGLIMLPFVYLLIVYPDLPARIPLHFDWRGNPDAWGPKFVLWVIPFLGVFVAFLTNLAVTKAAESGGSLPKHRAIGYLTLSFTTVVLCYIIYGTQAGGFNGLGGLSVMLGLLFGGLGNYLPILSQNPYVGIRIPPTLNDENNWRKTHRFAGPIFLLGGLVLIINGLFLRGGAETVVMIVLIGLISIIPIVYSYRLPKTRDDNFV